MSAAMQVVAVMGLAAPLALAATEGCGMPRLPRVTWKKVGGLTFVRVGRFSISFCRVRA